MFSGQRLELNITRAGELKLAGGKVGHGVGVKVGSGVTVTIGGVMGKRVGVGVNMGGFGEGVGVKVGVTTLFSTITLLGLIAWFSDLFFNTKD